MFLYFFVGIVIIIASSVLLIRILKGEIPRIYFRIALIILFVAVVILSVRHLYPYYETWMLSSSLKKNELFSLIAQKDPVEYEKFIKKVKENIRYENDPKLLQVYSSQLINKVYFTYLRNAPDKAIFSYVNTARNFYQYLNHTQPDVIVKLELGENVNPDGLDEKDIAFIKQILIAKKSIIEAAVQTPAKTPTAKEVSAYLKPIVQKLEQKYGDKDTKMFFAGGLSRLPVNAAVSLILDYYDEINARGEKAAGAIFRYTASHSSL